MCSCLNDSLQKTAHTVGKIAILMLYLSNLFGGYQLLTILSSCMHIDLIVQMIAIVQPAVVECGAARQHNKGVKVQKFLTGGKMVYPDIFIAFVYYNLG